MNKTIRLTLLAVTAAAALVLTSCDRMLESLFPSETGQIAKSGNNSLTFLIQGHDYYYQGTYYDSNYRYYTMSGYYGFWGDEWNGYLDTRALNPVYVSLYDSTTGYLISTQWTTFGNADAYGMRTASITFSDLNNGSYYFDVWYDLNNSGTLDVETASIYSGYYYQTTGYVGTTNLSSIHLPYLSSTAPTMTVNLNEYPYYTYYGP